MDAEDRELFERSLRHAVEASATPAELDAALDDLGWQEALASDPRVAVATLFELQGEVGATSGALGVVVAAALGLDPSLAAGLLLPPVGRTVAPATVAGDGVADRFDVAGLVPRAAGGTLGVLAVVADPGAGGEHVVATLPGADLARRSVAGLDPGLGLVEVGGRCRAVTRADLAPGAWPEAVAAGRRAIAHELLGAARAMLDMARGHALERVQFGRPIAAFQAVRHRLAESLVAIEAAAGAAGAAWDDGSPEAAAMAKALAGRSARTVARHAQQVLAGIGFTTEHPLHRHLRRVLVLDQLLGSARTLARDLGEAVLRDRRLPVPLPL
jgi:acyl-CoA dehydrogenase-like protein